MSTAIVLALKRARSLIDSRACKYICTTLEDSICANTPSRQLRRTIEKRLAPNSTLEDWVLSHNLVGEYTDLYSSYWSNVMREYRLRWIDALIEEFNS